MLLDREEIDGVLNGTHRLRTLIELKRRAYDREGTVLMAGGSRRWFGQPVLGGRPPMNDNAL